ncbi:uncharacterized protein MKK02DRAFT_31413 [Dioszegia hungarica]|uniref:Uncharacterized protein n=1 Tax=Dioszegia hungarica TaxID=4972 RepID=A0AA38HCX4_9TREE|nr:uncharacterized protein MKK02DRAFT_31413 [Dioszegia hungarica]KAI9637863.1 hypothetical protein MKK02DRAFT_31413 [Dioszegia hungarica]
MAVGLPLDPVALSAELLRVEALRKLKERRQASAERSSQPLRLSQLPPDTLESDLDEPKSVDRPRSNRRAATPGQLDSDEEDGASAVFTDGEEATEEDEDFGSDNAMDSDSSEEWEGEEEGTGEDEKMADLDREPSPSASAGDGIDPTLRAANAKLTYLQRRLSRLEKANTGHSAGKQRADRTANQLDAERALSAGYRRIVRALQQELAAEQQRSSTTAKERAALAAGKEAAEAKLVQSEGSLNWMRADYEKFRTDHYADRRTLCSEKEEAIARLKAVELDMRAVQDSLQEKQGRMDLAITEMAALKAQVEQAERATRVAEEQLATANTKHHTEAQHLHAKVNTAGVQIALETPERRRAVESESELRVRVEKADNLNREAAAREMLLLAKINRLDRKNGELEDKLEAIGGGSWQEGVGLRSAVEKAERRVGEAEKKRKEAEKQRQEAAERLEVLKEAHDMEREMYTRRIRDLTGRGKVKVERDGGEAL